MELNSFLSSLSLLQFVEFVIFSVWDLSDTSNVFEGMLGWNRRMVQKSPRSLWRLAPLCVIWCIRKSEIEEVSGVGKVL